VPATPSQLRSATDSDTTAIATLHRRAIDHNLPWLPRLHTPEEDRAFFRGVVADQQVLVLERSDQVVGFTAWSDGWLNHLYVDPAHQRLRVGKTLLEAVITDREAAKTSFQLWTFQRNFAARRFYEVNGLTPVEFTAGTTNEEREPDIRYAWSPSAG